MAAVGARKSPPSTVTRRGSESSTRAPQARTAAIVARTSAPVSGFSISLRPAAKAASKNARCEIDLSEATRKSPPMHPPGATTIFTARLFRARRANRAATRRAAAKRANKASPPRRGSDSQSRKASSNLASVSR